VFRSFIAILPWQGNRKEDLCEEVMGNIYQDDLEISKKTNLIFLSIAWKFHTKGWLPRSFWK
jgi:hypothetical protein